MLRLAFALALLGSVAVAEPRVIAVGGAVAEIVSALGAGETLVGVDTTSTYPPALRVLPKVGYLRNLPAEGALSLRPDLVVASAEAGPPLALQRWREAGVAVRLIEDPLDGEAAARRILAIGELLGRAEAGRALAEGLRRDLAGLERWRAAVAGRPRALFLLSVGQGPMLTGGRGTPADAMIRLAGGRNAAEGIEGYKPIAPEAALAMAPEVVVTTDRTVSLSGGAEAMLALPAVAATPAGRERRLVALDALYLLGFGPRLPQALKELGAALHPERPPT